MPKITYLDSDRLQRAINAGIHNVLSRKEYLNKINVFPVADADTGTNLAFTLHAILDGEIENIPDRIDDYLEKIADSALDGARGNSGAIMAQFFQGFSDGSKGIKKMTTSDFSRAVSTASSLSRNALSEPKEGTILTVINDFSDALEDCVDRGISDFELLFKEALSKTQISLENTPNLLPVLKQSGVVDAGAQGFVDLLDGIYEFVRSGSLKDIKDFKPLVIESSSNESHEFSDLESIKYKYCTECLINGQDIDINQLKSKLLASGADSLVLAGSNHKAKIHIHSNNPSDVFSTCMLFGTVTGHKIDDMKKQYYISKLKPSDKKIAIVTDSAADFSSNNYPNINVVPLKYNFGEVNHLDKISQSTDNFYNELQVNSEHPKTSQPSPGEFKRTYDFLSSYYESIISLHLPKIVSGTFQSAETASKNFKKVDISIVDTHSASAGQGLIAMYASELVDKGLDKDQILNKIEQVKSRTSIFLAINDISYSIKGGRVPSILGTVSRVFNFKLVLTMNNIGKVKPAGILWGSKNIEQKIYKFITKKFDKQKKYRIIISHSNCLEKANTLSEKLKQYFVNLDFCNIEKLGCALGVHAGPGSLLVGIQEVEA
tara:strand:+ start:127 stop:1938 length:1812 start_codon:yes stop_codon:yes gene_type:complete